jgi:ribosome-associated toxin RatA of RatAB toxin-antitoxin module
VYQASREFEDDVPTRHLLQAVWEVEGYPAFVSGVKRVAVLEREVDEDGSGKTLAQFTASMAGMEFDYVLEITRDSSQVRWRRVSGSFRDAAGAMVHLGGRRYRYENALDPGFAVPEIAVRFVLNRSLPRLLEQFRKRALFVQQRDG